MIRTINQSIFDANVDIILHSCNCFNTMGSGIAKEIKRRFPNAYAADQATRKGDKSKLGSFSFAPPTDEQNHWIINLYGQYRYGCDKRYTDYKAVEKALIKIREWLLEKNLEDKIIGIPYKMSCNRGGGDWKVIEDIIQTTFGDELFRVLICKK